LGLIESAEIQSGHYNGLRLRLADSGHSVRDGQRKGRREKQRKGAKRHLGKPLRLSVSFASSALAVGLDLRENAA